ncbi:MAG: class I tRNA ligase family protein [Armatimonadota bacterium]
MSETKYDFIEIEKKWQKKWKEDNIFKISDSTDKPKFYGLDFFPYPSGAGLSVGHCRNYIPTDVVCRFKRMNNFNVLHPMGWDAFGLPAENEAIRQKSHPKKTVPAYIQTYKRQMDLIGIGYDWSREINSSDPSYYKWTQWIFKLLYERGLAYRSLAPANWCEKCKTVLANEEVKDGKCWRCDEYVKKKDLPQWFFKITEYADRLIDDLDTIDWPESIKLMQKNWIGRSEGAEVTFHTEAGDEIVIYTTRPDTLWGATFMVLAPEHPLVEKLTKPEFSEAVKLYKTQAERQTAIERQSTEKEKTGVFIGSYAINPVNNNKIPIWIADYVMMGYGTGAIMAVPAHDERDFQFALKFGIEIIPVIDRIDNLAKSYVKVGYVKDGFVDAVKSAGIKIKESNDAYKISLDLKNKIDEYIKIASEYVKDNGFVEIVGAKWAVVFADGVMEFNSVESSQAILTKLKGLDSSYLEYRTLMEAFYSNQSYRDALFHAEYGDMINSAEFSGTLGETAKKDVTKWLEENGKGKFRVNFKLRDWLISRQRYWGCPIPIIHCKDCGIVPVPDKDLPVLLPDVDNYEPPGDGRSPLALIPEFVNTTCPKCGGKAQRETDTMGGFACSSWYFLRFVSPNLDNEPFDKQLAAYWLPVDLYVGGAEHAVMHLLYARFWTKVLHDAGLVPFVEPFNKLMNQGMVLAYTPHRTMSGAVESEESDLIPITIEQAKELGDKVIWKWVKMSKSKQNVITPDSMAEKFGADALRLYELFVAPFSDAIEWSEDGINGACRFLRRVWTLVNDNLASYNPNWSELVSLEVQNNPDCKALRRKLHQTIKKVGEDIDEFHFNTAVAALMELFNEMNSFSQKNDVSKSAVFSEAMEHLIVLLSPMTPHISDEMWEKLGKSGYLLDYQWPQYDEKAAKADEVEIVAQINGKVRDKIVVPADASEEQLKEIALASEKIQTEISGKTIKKVIAVPGKLVNIVVG